MAEEIAKYETDGGQEIELSAQVVRDVCAQGNAKVTDKEAWEFIQLCKAHRLNPFIREAYLVKYGNNATIITGKDVFTKRAARNENCEGFRAGVSVLNSAGQIIDREGSALFPQIGEVLLGGWAEVYMRGYQVPIKDTVSLAEYSTGKSGWAKMPGTMIRKVALVHALREAMPEEFGGLYDSAEMDQAHMGTARPQQPQQQPEAAYEPPEPEQPSETPTEQRLGQIAESVEFPSGEEERRAAEKRLRGMFIEGKQAGFDLQGFHAYARQAHGCDYLQMTTDQLTACADEFKRRLDRFQQASGEVEHVWE